MHICTFAVCFEYKEAYFHRNVLNEPAERARDDEAREIINYGGTGSRQRGVPGVVGV